MSELENLTRTLIQVVGSLQSILSQKGASTSTLEPEQQPKLKKTADMTYNQFVKKSLLNRKPVQVSSKKSSFKLQEDLQLLSELSNHNQISIKTFQEISKSKKVNRSTDSLRARYHDYLSRVDEKEMKKIVNWIEHNGIEGYLVWEEDDMKIQSNDPEEKKEEKKRQRSSAQQSEARKHEKLSKKSRTVPTNCKQLNQVLKLYSKMVNIPVKTLAGKLDQLSGDLVALDNYIETKDARMLWTEQEDEVLKKGGPELQVLKKYRGAGVETRRKYLGLA